MSIARVATAAAVGLIAAWSTTPASAQSAGADAEIALLKQQLRLMEQKLDKLQKQTSANTSAAAQANAKVDAKVGVANANAAIPVKGAVAPSGVVVTMPNNRPTICTADNQNCVSITSRVHFDVGGYDYRPNSALTSPQRLDDGVNARRARIGVLGKFFGDWNYALVYDFGGSSDGFGGAAAGSLPGGGTSGIENAYLSYTGFKPFGGRLAIEGGYMDVPYTLDEATSSNDILFMERSSSQVIATGIAGGDFRSAAGARWYNDQFWIGAYATGPTSGAIHSGSSTTPAGTREQLGVVARAAGQVVSGNNYSLHLGGNAEFLVSPARNQITGAQALTLSDRPELRIDPTSIISAPLSNVSGAQVYSVEAAATYGSLFFQGEYFWYNIDRGANLAVALPSAKFDGGYAQASYVLTGETHTYNSATASYNGIAPANPFSLNGGGWGAFEIAGRVSVLDLNDQLGTVNGIAGGKQTVYTAGLNWYANRNIRLMLNYLHGDIAKQASSTSVLDTGAQFDAVAMRTQIAF
jgi:phosphate-selective porin OprO/OprP